MENRSSTIGSPAVNRLLSNIQLSVHTPNRSWFEETEEFEQQIIAVSVLHMQL